ncbi:protein app1-like [Anoplophora glabripennis]|uniref:protein app1-like n=1 Tax=Anoplophora glabripennis TaxID=217634 RepID=UPI000874511B|nr:protein app1-like [Anoplophora glabripennis]
MRRFAIIVIALVFAPGLQAGIGNFPAPMPLPETETIPLPEAKPLPIPDVEAVIPELGVINPCDACFQYMTALIDQLTEVAVPEIPVHPELPEVELEPEVPEIGRPLPEIVPEDIRPLPIPVAPEVEVNPIPIPVAPETDVRPLPIPVAPEVEIIPIPIPIAPEASAPPAGSWELLPEDY